MAICYKLIGLRKSFSLISSFGNNKSGNALNVCIHTLAHLIIHTKLIQFENNLKIKNAHKSWF